jgi:hypothetical protein
MTPAQSLAAGAQLANDQRAAIALAESALGENLVWLSDHFDLEIRQRDPETMRRLAQLNAAWIALAKVNK